MQLTVGLWLADGPGACGGVPRYGSVEGGGVGARVSEHFLTLLFAITVEGGPRN
jgi:hypothetical protein